MSTTTDKHAMMAWAIVWAIVFTAIGCAIKVTIKLTEPCPTATVACPHIPFATVRDMNELSEQLIECNARQGEGARMGEVVQ